MVVRDPAADSAVDWWRRAVIYQIYPRSFREADGRSGIGNLAGVTAQLHHLAWLGADAVWISPFYRSPMRDFGYDVEDHRAVDPIFGTLADCDALLAEARRLGLRVLVDLVASHCADTHPWFQAASAGRGRPYEGCFVWADPKPDGGPPNNWVSVFGGSAWAWCEARGQFYLHNFLTEQPDLNFHSPQVRAEVLSIARFWLDRGVSGFRLDAINFAFHDPALRDNPPATAIDTTLTPGANPYSLQAHIYDKNRPELCDFLESFGALLAEYPGAIGLGEVGEVPEKAAALIGQYTAPGRLHLCYSFELLGERLDPEHIEAVIRRAEQHGGEHSWAFSNHDVTRAATRLCPPGEDPEAVARVAMALLMALRGVPCIYQGEALGLEQAEVPYERLVDPYGLTFWPEYKGRDGCRTPMPWRADGVAAGFSEAEPWLPIPQAHRARSVQAQRGDPGSTLELCRALIARRRSSPALHSGSIRILSRSGPTLAFERRSESSKVVCVFNLSGGRARWRQIELEPWGWRYM